MHPKSPQALARAIHRSARLVGPPYDMQALAAALGCEVEWVDPSLFGGAVACRWGRRILVARSSTQGRNAWSVAHEIAHLAATDAGILHDERFADQVAAELLMPRADFLRAAARSHNLPALAENFGCSLEATGRRFLDLLPSMLVIRDGGGRAKALHSAPVPPEVYRLTRTLTHPAFMAKAPRKCALQDWSIGAWNAPEGRRAVGLATPERGNLTPR